MTPPSADSPADVDHAQHSPVEPARLAALRRYNVVVGIVLVAQAVVVYLLSNDFTLPITASYLEGPPGTTPGDPVTLMNTPIGLAVAGFLALSGIALLIVIFLVTYVVPQVAGVFASSRRALPLLTVAMLALSDFARTWAKNPKPHTLNVGSEP